MEGVCLEPDCGFVSTHLFYLHAHLVREHNKPMDVKRFIFSSMRGQFAVTFFILSQLVKFPIKIPPEFKVWKASVELQDLVKLRASPLQSQDGDAKVGYHFCIQPEFARYGCSQVARCTTMLVVHETSERVRVNYFKTHYNHHGMSANLLAEFLSHTRPDDARKKIHGDALSKCSGIVTPPHDSAEDDERHSHRVTASPRHASMQRTLWTVRVGNLIVKTIVPAQVWRVSRGQQSYKVSAVGNVSTCLEACSRCFACRHSYACSCHRSSERFDVSCAHAQAVQIARDAEREVWERENGSEHENGRERESDGDDGEREKEGERVAVERTIGADCDETDVSSEARSDWPCDGVR